MTIVPFIRGILYPGCAFHSFLYFSHNVFWDIEPEELVEYDLYISKTYTIGSYVFAELDTSSSNLNTFPEDSSVAQASEELCWHTMYDFELVDGSAKLRTMDDFYEVLFGNKLLTNMAWCLENTFAETELTWKDIYIGLSGSVDRLLFELADLRITTQPEKIRIDYRSPVSNDELCVALNHVLMSGFGVAMDAEIKSQWKPGRIIVECICRNVDRRKLNEAMKDGMIGFIPGIGRIMSISNEKGELWTRPRTIRRSRSRSRSAFKHL